MSDEVFVAIPGYEYYTISNYGRVYSTFSNKFKALKYKPNGYLAIDLSIKGKHYIHHMHRLVANAFINNPLNKPDVNHIDGNKHNNHFSNLEWVTKSENMRHAVDTGLVTYQTKLTEEDIQYCLLEVLNGASIRQLADKFVCSTQMLKKRVNLLAKSNGVYDEYVAQLKTKLGELNRIPIIQMSLNGDYVKLHISISEATRDLGLSGGNIHNAISGKYKHCGGFTWRYATEEEYL